MWGGVYSSAHLYPASGIETLLSLVLTSEFLWVVYLWSYLTAINYLGVYPDLDALWVTDSW